MSKSTTTAIEIIQHIQGIAVPGSTDRFLHPADTQKTAIVVKVNSWRGIGPLPVEGAAHEVAAALSGLISYRRLNVFNWI